MSASELYASANDNNFGGQRDFQNSISNSFMIGDVFGPERIFPNLKRSAYHIVESHLNNKMELPYGQPVNAAIMGMMGYQETKRNDLIDFAQYLDRNLVGLPFAIVIYSELGNVRALGILAESIKRGDKQEGINHKGLIRRAFGELYSRVSEEEVRAEIEKIGDEEIKRRMTEGLEYFAPEAKV